MTPESVGHLALTGCAALGHSLWLAALHHAWLRRRPIGAAPTTPCHVAMLLGLVLVVPVGAVLLGQAAIYGGTPPTEWTSTVAAPRLSPRSVATGVIVIWLAGATIGAARWLAAVRRTRALVHASRPVPPLQLDDGRTLAIRETDAAIDPCVVGLWRPAVLLPSAATGALTDLQRTVVLRHEAAHVLLGDPITEQLLRLVEVIGWWNPWVHRIAARIRLERELRSDRHAAVTLDERRALAEGLLALGEARLATGVLRLGGAQRSDLTHRIAALLTEPPERPARAFVLGALFLPVVGAIALAHPTGHVVRELHGTRVIAATDPAGEFVAVVEGGRLDAVAIGGVPLDVRQRGRIAEVHDRDGALVLTLTMRVHGFSWDARAPDTPSPSSTRSP